MCGICGIVYVDRDHQVDKRELLIMRDALAYRGPDDSGDYVAPGVGLGSRRLAILDLSDRGHMPMSTADGRFWITYNGEIYNFEELRRNLESKGYEFRSKSDTEVALCLYAEDGPAMLDRLNGMFAFAIWDSQQRTLFVARDRLGIKPLYYTFYQGALYFASEEKALFAAGMPVEFDHDIWEELLCFRYIAGERTPFLGIRRLLPGHYMIWRDGEVKIRRWWNLAEKAKARRECLPADPVAWYGETFDDAVTLRRISDVPIGVLLSGGLDSSTVSASLSLQAGSGTASFTVRFTETDYDEGPLARQVAERWQMEPYEVFVPADNLVDKLKEASWFNDEPLVHGNDLHLLSISQHAKPRVTVLLSGEGADETLGGYVRYRPLRYPSLLSMGRRVLPKLSNLLQLDGRWRKLARFLEFDSLDRFVLFNACDTLPNDLTQLGLSPNGRFLYREQVLAEAGDLYPHDYARQAMYSDQHTFLCSVLDRNDRMTMGASIECRVPFLDYRLVETLAALPSSTLFMGQKSKGLLRAAMGSRLPSAVLRHRKWGFGVPWKKYLREIQDLRLQVLQLPNNRLIVESPLNSASIEKRVRDFLHGDDKPFPLIMQLLMTVLAWDTVRERVSTRSI